MGSTNLFTRRSLLLAAAPALLAHGPFGPVKPALPVPDSPLLRHDGKTTTLQQLLAGHVSAVQWIFTSCRATCPIQGTIFARAQKKMPGFASRNMQLVTLSVDPARDSPAALSKWLKQFHADRGWVAAAPPLIEVDRLRQFFGGGNKPADNHTTQIFLVDRSGALVWRTEDLPQPEPIAQMLEQMASR